MEPQQQVLRTGLYIIIGTRDVLTILAGGIRSCTGAIKTDTVVVGFVIVNGAPLQRIAGYETIGLWTVVMIKLEDVVQTFLPSLSTWLKQTPYL